MCTASSKYSGSLIKSLILDWKVHPFAKSWISTVFMSLKSLHTFVLHLNLATGTHLMHTPVCTSQVKLEEFQEREWVNKQTAAASQIWAQDGNSAPPYVQLTEIQRSARGRGLEKPLWSSKEQLYVSSVLRLRQTSLLCWLTDLEQICTLPCLLWSWALCC